MAASTQQKVDFLLKKIGYTASKTGLAEDSSLSGTKKAPFAEAVPSPLVIASASVWADSADIPATPPGSDSSYVKVYLGGTSGHHMTVDSTVSGNRSYIAYSTYNNNSTAILGDWIDTQFGSSYIIKVYKGDPNSGGVSLSAAGSGSSDGWFFDYSSGILNFNDTNVPSGVTDSNIYVVGYRYIGTKGVVAPGGVSNNSQLNVTGVSTFTGAVDANGGADISGGVGLNVVGHTEVDNFNASGVSTFAAAIDANAGILASTLKVEDLTATRVVLAGTGGEIEDNAKLTFTTDKLAVTGGLTVSAGATFAGIVDGNAGANISGGEATFASATVSDLTDNRVVIAGTSGALEDSGNLTFSGTKLTVTGNAQVTTDLDVDGGANISGGVGLDVVGHTELDEVNVSGVSTFNDNVRLLDNDKLQIGTSQDLEFYHDTTDSRIENSQGDIKFKNAGSYYFFDEDGGETLASFINDGAVNIYFGGAKKLETTFTGLSITGITTISGAIDGNGGADISGGETTLSSATVSDLTNDRVVIAGTSGALEDSGNLTFNGTKLTVTGNAQITTDLDVDGGANISGGETILSSATVSDLTNNRVVLAGTSGSLEDSSAITFDGSNLAIVGGATFTGNVTIGGTLTSEDKTNVDSVGLITARTGVRITSGGLIVSAGVNTFTDAIDANGGANIAGGFVANSAKVSDLTSGRVVVAGTDGELEDASTFTFSGGTVTATNFSGNLTGTLQTAAQPNVTSLGTIASLVASTAKVSDLTATRVVLAGTAGELEDNSKLTFTTDKLAVTGGLTVSAGATLSSNLNVDGGADISGGVGLNVVGHTELDNLNVSGVSTYAGSLNANGTVNIAGQLVTVHNYHQGVSTFVANIDANRGIHVSGGIGLEVVGHTELDNLVVSGVSTFSSLVDGNAGANFSGAETVLSSATVSDLTENRIVIAGADGALEDASTLTFDGTKVQVGSAITMYQATGIVSATYFYGDGSNLLNAGSTLSAASAVQRVVTTSLTSGTMTTAGTDADLTFDTSSNTLNAGKVNVAGVGTFGGLIDGNAGATITGAETTLSSATVSDLTDERVVLAGSSGALEDSGNLTFNGTKLTVTGNAQVTTDLDVDGGANISGGVGLNVVGHTELDEVNISGVSTYGGAADFNAGVLANTLKVEDLSGARVVVSGTGGEIEDSANLTWVSNGANYLGLTGGLTVSAASTFSGAIDGNGGADISGGETTLSSATVSDLTSGRVVVAGTSGALEDASTFTFSGGTVSATAFSATNLTGTLQTAAQGNVTSLGTLTGLAVNGDLDLHGPAGVSSVTWDKSDNALEFLDHAKATFGTGGDFSLQFDGTNSIVAAPNSGELSIRGKVIELRRADLDEPYLRGTEQAAVEIFHDNSKKIETTSSGAVVTGVLTATTFSGSGASLNTLNASELDSGTIPSARYGTGNTFVKLRGTTGASDSGTNTFAGSGAGAALNGSSGDHNTFFGRSAGGANDTGTNNAFYGSNAGVSNVTGSNLVCVGYQADATNTSTSNEVTLGNDSITKFRVPGIGLTFTSSGIGILTATQHFSGDIAGVGATFTNVTGTLQTAAQTNITSVGTLGGLTITGGNLVITDSSKITMGSGNVLQMNHFGGNTFLEHTSASGAFYIQGDDLRLTNKDRDETYIECDDEAGVQINYTNSKKFETTHTGAIVTGILTATQHFSGEITGVGATFTNVTGTLQTAAQPNVTSLGTIASLVASTAKVSDLTVNRVVTVGASGELQDSANLTYNGVNLGVNGINVTGNILAPNAGNFVAIGTANALGAGTDRLAVHGSGTDSGVRIWCSASAHKATAVPLQVADTSGTELFRVHADGKVGINSTSPGEHLDVVGIIDIKGGANQLRITSTSPAVKFTDSDAPTGFGMVGVNNTSGSLVLRSDDGNALSSSYMGFEVDGSETLRIDSNGRLLVGHTASIDQDSKIQSFTTGTDTFAGFKYGDNAAPNIIRLGKSRNASAGGNTIVADNDEIGRIGFVGADGSDFQDCAAVQCFVDGTPSNGTDMPGRLILSTTADAEGVLTERLRISSDGTADFNSNTLQKAVLKNYTETIKAIGNTGTSTTLDLADGNVFTATLNGNCTFTFTTGTNSAPNAQSFTLILTNDGSAGRTIAWPASVKFPNASTPSRTTAASKTDIWSFMSPDNGTTWYGNIALYNFS